MINQIQPFGVSFFRHVRGRILPCRHSLGSSVRLYETFRLGRAEAPILQSSFGCMPKALAHFSMISRE